MVNPCFDKVHVSVVLKNKQTNCLCTKAAKKKCCHFVINFVESGWALVTYMLSSKWSMSTVQCPTKSIDFFLIWRDITTIFLQKRKATVRSLIQASCLDRQKTPSFPVDMVGVLLALIANDAWQWTKCVNSSTQNVHLNTAYEDWELKRFPV